MPKAATLSPEELSELDRVYREGGLRAMASPHVHYDEPELPHPGCGQRMEWIDFKLELHGDPEGRSTSPWSAPGGTGRGSSAAALIVTDGSNSPR